MSRSIHENRAKKGFHPVEWDEIETKRRIKRLVREDRRVVRTPSPGVASQPEVVPIVFDSEVGFCFCPITEREIRGTLGKLPRDACRGVRTIRICRQPGPKPRYIPLSALMLSYGLGALRDRFASGIFIPWRGGVFNTRTGDVRLHYLAHTHGLNPTPVEQATMKAIVLETLVHEIAHAYDRAHRVHRGRWRMDDDPKDERYAERMADAWFRAVLLPRLERLARG